MIRHLEPDRRRALRPLFADDFKQSKRLFRELRDNQRHLEQALLTEPFDEAAAREAFKSLQKSSEAVQLQMHEQMIILMKNLNLEERKQVLKQIGRPPRRDPGKKDMGFIRRGDESRYNAPFEFSDAQYGSGKIEP